MIYSIYLDTEIFRHIKCNFEHPHIKQLLNLKEKEIVELIITDITHKEILKYLESTIVEVFSDFQKIKNKLPRLYKRDQDVIGVNLEMAHQFEAINISCLKSKYQNFIDENFRMIDCYSVDSKVVFDKYFAGELPFSNKSNKKFEFPDAFILEGLKCYQERSLRQILVITADNGLGYACRKIKNFEYFMHMEDALDFIYRKVKGEEYAFIQKNLYRNRRIFIDEMKLFLQSPPFYSAYFFEYKEYLSEGSKISYEILEGSIEKIQFNDFNITEITSLIYKLEIIIKVSFLLFLEVIGVSSKISFKDKSEYPADKDIKLSLRVKLAEPLNASLSAIESITFERCSADLVILFDENELWDLYISMFSGNA